MAHVVTTIQFPRLSPNSKRGLWGTRLCSAIIARFYYVAEFKIVLLSACFRWKSFVLRFEESVCFFSLLQLTIKSMQTNKQTGKYGSRLQNDPASFPPSFFMIVRPRAVFACYNHFKALDLLLLTKRKRLCCRFVILITSRFLFLHFFLSFYVLYPGGVTLPFPYFLVIFVRDHVGIVLHELSSNQRQSLEVTCLMNDNKSRLKNPNCFINPSCSTRRRGEQVRVL